MILKAEEISKSYRGRKVVNNISIKVDQGEIVGLLGPNGAGIEDIKINQNTRYQELNTIRDKRKDENKN
jgi:ABC-type lipopolysaccharide export system ATPase subunit